jgi:hypothetical protein
MATKAKEMLKHWYGFIYVILAWFWKIAAVSKSS